MSRMTEEMTRVSAEPCRCVSCPNCDGRGSYAVNMRGQYIGPSRTDDLDDLETCESCGGSGITETCDRCQLLEEMADHQP